MKNMKLGTKIFGMVAVILALMVIGSGFGIIKMRSIGDEITGITKDDIPLTNSITEIAIFQLDQEICLERALRYGEVLQKGSGKEKLKTVEEEFNKLNKSVDEEIKKAEKILEHAIQGAKNAEKRKEFTQMKEELKTIDKGISEFEKDVLKIFALIQQGKIHEAEGLSEKVEKEGKDVEKDLNTFLKKVEKFTEDAAATALRDEQSGQLVMSVVSIISLIFGITLAIFITRGITRPINKTIEGLTDGAEQVVSASSQVSSASQSLAEGASEQAAGIEETSSSIEEMSSMTKQNADNARQANTLMAETGKVVEEANRSMSELTGSMKEISAASEETAKIIKTIDEIAFQTNLLALNAAVEAARAGEAGAGFAVVADEVRNLAMRAADAAKNTANLIEGTVKKIKNGSDIVSKTNEAFSKVATGAKKVGELVGEISAASNEQAQGIDQINKAVSEMDKVVQKNAASAEESASASEEMNAQAETMKGFVAELVAVVGGRNGNGISTNADFGMRSAESKKPGGNGKRHVGQLVSRVTSGVKKKDVKIHPKAMEPRPDHVIPMGEGDFKEF